MSDLLLELFSEEIPARMQMRATKDLERLLNDALLKEGFLPEGVKAFATPRRLSVIAQGLPVQQADSREERKGPRIDAPEKAIAGFLRGAGLESVDQCEIREDSKGQFYVAIQERAGRDTADILQNIISEIVRDFPWPKTQRWGNGNLRWVRPLRSILCTFDGDIVPVEIDDLTASDRTTGHRFLAPDEIQVRSFDQYAAKLRQAKVVLDPLERQELIAAEAKTLCEAQGLQLIEDKGLLVETAGLAEWPVVMIGQFDEKFLELPEEVLIASMRGHQKYFAVRRADGKLANRFVVVANIEAPDGGKAMRIGYERVLTARLSDGWFLYQQDMKVPLRERVHDLDAMTFFAGLGSVGEKIKRISHLAQRLAPLVNADPARAVEAAALAKADLVTGMVYEFPELQGIMGRDYYLKQADGNHKDVPPCRRCYSRSL